MLLRTHTYSKYEISFPSHPTAPFVIPLPKGAERVGFIDMRSSITSFRTKGPTHCMAFVVLSVEPLDLTLLPNISPSKTAILTEHRNGTFKIQLMCNTRGGLKGKPL